MDRPAICKGSWIGFEYFFSVCSSDLGREHVVEEGSMRIHSQNGGETEIDIRWHLN